MTTKDEGGTISLCPKADCGFRCCEFQQGNYIVLHPGELAAAEAEGRSLDHLEVFQEERGGHRAICRAQRTADCDGGYKPLDCRSYPYFPLLDEDGSSISNWVLKGRKCPLVPHELDEHGKWMIEQWQALVDASPEVGRWLAGIALVGYELTAPVDAQDHEPAVRIGPPNRVAPT